MFGCSRTECTVLWRTRRQKLRATVAPGGRSWSIYRAARWCPRMSCSSRSWEAWDGRGTSGATLTSTSSTSTPPSTWSPYPASSPGSTPCTCMISSLRTPTPSMSVTYHPEDVLGTCRATYVYVCLASSPSLMISLCAASSVSLRVSCYCMVE